MKKFNLKSLFSEKNDFHSTIIKFIHDDPFEFINSCRDELKDGTGSRFMITKFARKKYVNERYEEDLE